MNDDKITVMRNEFDLFLDSVGEDKLSDDATVRAAIELENKIKAYEQQN